MVIYNCDYFLLTKRMQSKMIHQKTIIGIFVKIEWRNEQFCQMGKDIGESIKNMNIMPFNINTLRFIYATI